MFYRPKIQLILLILIAFFIISCQKEIKYPPTPVIQYNSFTILPNSTNLEVTGILNLTFTDGDGDIGMTQAEADVATGSNNTDLFIEFLEYQGSSFKPFLIYNNTTKTYDTINYNSRIPFVTPEGTNKNIKGYISDTLVIYNSFPPKKLDTIEFQVYIIDRAGNKSNVVTTPGIIIRY